MRFLRVVEIAIINTSRGVVVQFGRGRRRVQRTVVTKTELLNRREGYLIPDPSYESVFLAEKTLSRVCDAKNVLC